MLKKFLFFIVIFASLIACGYFITAIHYKEGIRKEGVKVGDYWVVEKPTLNFSKCKNEIKGIVLHHTAAWNIKNALEGLTNPKKKTSCHVVIDKDGTRYILADLTKVTWHAGYSILNGRSNCNRFTIGIEFQGNTLKKPLTEKQINSAIDYILPIMQKYKIEKKNIVTHKQIRTAWIEKYPKLAKKKNIASKPDITDEEHKRFMQYLNARLQEL